MLRVSLSSKDITRTINLSKSSLDIPKPSNGQILKYVNINELKLETNNLKINIFVIIKNYLI